MSQWMLYLHVNPSNDEIFYVGIGINKRPWDMIRRNPIWHKYVKKYGKPKVMILESGLSEKDAADKELVLIQHYKRKIDGGSLANILIEHRMNPLNDPGVKARWLAIMRSDEVRRKMKVWMSVPENKALVLKSLHSPESKAKSAAYSKSEENRERMSISNPMYLLSSKLLFRRIFKGRHFTDETKAKMSKAKKGQTIPDYLLENLKKRLADGWNPMDSDNARRKVSQALKGRKHSPQHKRKNGQVHSKSVYQYSLENVFIARFKSAREAAKHIGCTAALIGMCCNDKIKTAKGYHWKFTQNTDS